MLTYSLDSYQTCVTNWGQISSFTTFPGGWVGGWLGGWLGGWGGIEIKANSAQLELELGLSLATDCSSVLAHKPLQACKQCFRIFWEGLRTLITKKKVITDS